MNVLRLVASCLLIAASAAARAQESRAPTPQRFMPAQLVEDLRIARTALEQGHPGIYRYATSAQVDRAFDAAERRLNRPMDVYAFYRILAPTVATIECGHTRVGLSSAEQQFVTRAAALLPLDVRLIDGKVYVYRDLSPEQARLAGKQIRAINGVPIEKITMTLLAATPRDGEIPTTRPWRLSHGWNFNVGIYTLAGIRAPFTIAYDDGDVDRRVKLSGLTLPRLAEASGAGSSTEPREQGTAAIEFLDDGKIAVMTIYGFGGYADPRRKQTVAAFYKESFEQMASRGTHTLLLDLRNNGGGEDELGKLLFSYLTDSPFDYYEDLLLNGRTFDFLRYASGLRSIPENLVQPIDNGHFRATSHPNWGRQQPNKPTFSGRVLILTNGGSFSTTCEFISITHYHHRAMFIGQEPAGGYYGNCSGFMPNVILPNTKVSLRVPLMKYVMAVKGYRYPKRGVLPDVPVQNSIEDLIAARDREMEVALALAREPENSVTSRAGSEPSHMYDTGIIWQ